VGKKVVAIVGSYRRGGTVDTAVEAVLEGARARGASTHTIYLTDKHIEFCTNCRTCAQAPGLGRGKCVLDDELNGILTEIDASNSIVLASSVNCGNVTAIFRRFLERLMGYVYWPWGQPAPKSRSKVRHLNAVLVASSAMPAPMMLLFTGTANALRMAAAALGAKVVGNLWLGLAAAEPHHELSRRTLQRAKRLGVRLA
jgi:multimeric flavodoxin WrbA